MSRPNGSHGTKAEKNRRIHRVCQMILRGLDSEAIFLAAEQLGWDISRRTLQTYIATARKRLEEAAAVERLFELGKANARFELIFGEALREKDYPSAIKAENSRVDLMGLKVKPDPDGETMTVVDEWLSGLRGEA